MVWMYELHVVGRPGQQHCLGLPVHGILCLLDYLSGLPFPPQFFRLGSGHIRASIVRHPRVSTTPLWRELRGGETVFARLAYPLLFLSNLSPTAPRWCSATPPIVGGNVVGSARSLCEGEAITQPQRNTAVAGTLWCYDLPPSRLGSGWRQRGEGEKKTGSKDKRSTIVADQSRSNIDWTTSRETMANSLDGEKRSHMIVVNASPHNIQSQIIRDRTHLSIALAVWNDSTWKEGWLEDSLWYLLYAVYEPILSCYFAQCIFSSDQSHEIQSKISGYDP